MAGQLDLVITTVTSAFGTSSNIPLGSAATVGGVTFLSFSGVGAVTNTTYDYSILDTGNSEIGTAIYLSSTNILGTRTPTKSTNGGAAITASSQALIYCALRAETAATFFNQVTKQSFTSSGTYTASTGMIYAIVEGVGGGGAGGAATCGSTTNNNMFAGGSGQGGHYSRLIITSTYSGTTFVIGAGGTGGSSNGAAGGDTVFGSSVLTARGGGFGLAGNTSQFGFGGTSSSVGTGDLTFFAQAGPHGIYYAGAAGAPLLLYPSPPGGPSFFGGAAIPSTANTFQGSVAGTSGRNYGGGGAGGVAQNNLTTANGGSGSNGILFVTEFCRI